MINTITINGVEYVRADSVQPMPTGNRAVVVIDRGWIFAGDTTKGDDGTLTITNAVHVFRWESVGFDGVIANPKSTKVTLKKMTAPVVVPAASVIFSVPVAADWGV